jgi:hypothetical protein
MANGKWDYMQLAAQAQRDRQWDLFRRSHSGSPSSSHLNSSLVSISAFPIEHPATEVDSFLELGSLALPLDLHGQGMLRGITAPGRGC